MTSTGNMAQEALSLLCSSAKLERDRGVLELSKFLTDAGESEVRSLESSVQGLLCDTQAPWETKHGALMGTKALLLHSSQPCSDEFSQGVNGYAIRLLEDGESRVRLAAGEVMGALCSRNGAGIFMGVKDIVLEGVKVNLERQPVTEQDENNTGQLLEKLVAGDRAGKRRGSADAEQIFHDTAGWKSLETWMKCLQEMINGCGTRFNAHIDQDLLDLIFNALSHTNRFVRETGYYVCAALVGCNYSEAGDVVVPPEENAVYQMGDQFAQQVATGLADNWSQVRLAASTAARKFLLGLPSEEARQKFYHTLLPPLCLNRYYVAEGVRIYNQDTWKQVTDGSGKHLVEVYIKEIVEFYIKQTEADNHAVREAACACIAELGSKIEKDVVRPFVPALLDALLVCFRDQSWPVRDASCVACGNFILCFPEESRATMPSLYPLFYENLQDNIPSVRQGAALALANVVRAYGAEALSEVIGKVKVGLEGVEHQPENVEKYGSLDKGPATYGVVKRLRDNDMDIHTDQTMYSCGSLAPKMHRGTREGGCMDHQFKRPAELWELGEGCVHLLAELSSVPQATQEVTKLLPLLAKASNQRHYTQHVGFLESVCKDLPTIAKGIGKRPFKMYLEMFLDPVFYSISCDNALTSSAASQCLTQLSTLIGPNILRGRVEQYNPAYLDQLQANIFIGPL